MTSRCTVDNVYKWLSNGHEAQARQSRSPQVCGAHGSSNQAARDALDQAGVKRPARCDPHNRIGCFCRDVIWCKARVQMRSQKKEERLERKRRIGKAASRSVLEG
jgi:hypothetical protein